MVKEISKGLKRTFLINFIVSLVFGVLLFFLPEIYLEYTGISFQTPFLFGGLFGGALLAFACASFLAWRETEWERIKIVMIMHIIWNMLGAFVFFWAIIYLSSNPWFYLIYKIMNLGYLTIFLGFLAAFIFFYTRHEKEQLAPRDDTEPVQVVQE